jgi:hypothetical protein
MKERRKVWDHVDVLCLVSFDEFIKDLKETRKAIMIEHPETKKSDFRISVGPFNHCVHVDFKRWETQEEIAKREKRLEEIRKEVDAYMREIDSDIEEYEAK